MTHGGQVRDDRLPVDLFSLQGVPDPQNAFILLPPIVGMMICTSGKPLICFLLLLLLLLLFLCKKSKNLESTDYL